MKHLEKTICMYMEQYDKIFVWKNKNKNKNSVIPEVTIE